MVRLQTTKKLIILFIESHEKRAETVHRWRMKVAYPSQIWHQHWTKLRWIES